MKVVISRVDLIEMINKIQTVVPSKPSLPVLSYVLLEAQDDELVLSATDLMVSMRLFAPANVLEEGAQALPARQFFQLIREFTAPQVELHSLSQEQAYLNCGTSHFKIQGMGKEEYPALPSLEDGIRIKMPHTQLKEMLARTLFAAAREDSRKALNGILLELQNHFARCTGTDGKRLARLRAPFASVDGEQEGAAYILPVKAVEEIIKLLSDHGGDVELVLHQDKIALAVQNVTLFSKLIVSQYPDVSRVIPQTTENPLILHREELISLLRQIALLTPETTNSVRFIFSPGELQINAASAKLGEGKVSMPVNYTGPKMEVAFNPQYFIDILRHSKDETVNLSITDPYNPGLITDSTDAEFVIMPMRLEPQEV